MAFGVSFIGSIPPGVLNLTVIDVTRTQNIYKAFYFALAGGLVEFGQSFIALKFSDFLALNETVNCYIQVLVVPIFLILSLYFLFKKDKSEGGTREVKEVPGDSFIKGFILSVANPLSIPFWLIWGTFFVQKGWLVLTDINILVFCAGVSLGSIATLICYALLSKFILSRIKALNNWINQLIGFILLSLAAYQIYLVITKNYLACL